MLFPDDHHAGGGAAASSAWSRRTQRSSQREGVPFGEDMPVGVMLEVPAAALCIDAMLDEVDFVTIGSNDLIQYLMAADRDNPKVAHLCEPFSPADLRPA